MTIHVSQFFKLIRIDNAQTCMYYVRKVSASGRRVWR